MGAGFKVKKLRVMQIWAHKKYKKKSDAKAIARKIKKISSSNQDDPYQPFFKYDMQDPPFRRPERCALMQFIQDGDKIIRKYVGVDESPYYGPHLLDSFPVKDPSFYL